MRTPHTIIGQRLDQAFLDRGEQDDGLQGLAQAHIIRQARAEAMPIQEGHPGVARVLVVAGRDLQLRQGLALQTFEAHQRIQHAALRLRQLALNAMLGQHQPVQHAHSWNADQLGEVFALGLVFQLAALTTEHLGHAREALQRGHVHDLHLPGGVDEMALGQQLLPLRLRDEAAGADDLGLQLEEVHAFHRLHADPNLQRGDGDGLGFIGQLDVMLLARRDQGRQTGQRLHQGHQKCRVARLATRRMLHLLVRSRAEHVTNQRRHGQGGCLCLDDAVPAMLRRSAKLRRLRLLQLLEELLQGLRAGLRLAADTESGAVLQLADDEPALFPRRCERGAKRHAQNRVAPDLGTEQQRIARAERKHLFHAQHALHHRQIRAQRVNTAEGAQKHPVAGRRQLNAAPGFDLMRLGDALSLPLQRRMRGHGQLAALPPINARVIPLSQLNRQLGHVAAPGIGWPGHRRAKQGHAVLPKLGGDAMPCLPGLRDANQVLGLHQINQALTHWQKGLLHQFAMARQATLHAQAVGVQAEHYLALPAADMALVHRKHLLVQLNVDREAAQRVVEPLPERFLWRAHAAPQAGEGLHLLRLRGKGILRVLGERVTEGEQRAAARADQNMPLSLALGALGSHGALVLAQQPGFQPGGQHPVGQASESAEVLQQVRHQHEAGEMMRAGLRRMLITAPSDAPVLQPHTVNQRVQPLRELDLQLIRPGPVQVSDVAHGQRGGRLCEQGLGRECP